jgi:hypothetical protein
MAHGPNIIFRDAAGKFVKYSERYLPKVAMVQARRRGEYEVLAERVLPPEDLADLLSGREFEQLPEATTPFAEYTSNKKYKAWDIAEQIDSTRGVRRKDLKITMEIMDGKRKKQLSFYQKIKSNQKSSYHLFKRMNEELGFEGLHLYKTAGGKHLADRKGRKVRLVRVRVEEVQ